MVYFTRDTYYNIFLLEDMKANFYFSNSRNAIELDISILNEIRSPLYLYKLVPARVLCHAFETSAITKVVSRTKPSIRIFGVGS